MCPNAHIYSLKIRGEKASVKIKKRKIDLGKSIGEDKHSCRPSTISLFEEITMEMRAIKEFVADFP